MQRARRAVMLIGLSVVLSSECARDRLPATTPFGFVDAPVPGAHLQPTFLVRGWALDDERALTISATIDRKIHVPISFRVAREDVARAFPRYARHTARAGWMAVVTVPAPGRHSLVVRYADSAGHTYDIGPIAFEVDPPAVPAIGVAGK